MYNAILRRQQLHTRSRENVFNDALQRLALDAAALWVAIKGVRVGGIRLGNAFHYLRLAIEPK